MHGGAYLMYALVALDAPLWTPADCDRRES
jgi:hypothetical protein